MLSNILGTLGNEKTQFCGVRLAKVGLTERIGLVGVH